ncbi:MAG: TetR/AcrR family transcriptional regulator [Bacteroidales bacterium]|nr:TetR/AcrR family transcriptional regulator [Bacteroidales bacterium]
MTQKKDAKNKKQQILDAAEYEFLTNGYEATKTTQIAKRAGVTHAMLHYYYQSKENLFNKIFEDKIETLKAPIDALAQNKDIDLRDRIREIIELHFDFLKTHPDLPHFLINEMRSNPQLIKILREKVGDTLRGTFATIQTEIDEYVAKDIMKPISAFDLFLDIVSLNVFTFISLPIFRHIAYNEEKEQQLIENRKKEIIQTINYRILK